MSSWTLSALAEAPDTQIAIMNEGGCWSGSASNFFSIGMLIFSNCRPWRLGERSSQWGRAS